MMTRISTTFLFLFLVTSSAACADDYAPWHIVSAADWHSAEGGVTSPDPAKFEENQRREMQLIRGTVFCEPDVVLVAGDVGSGHWTVGQLTKAGVLKQGETIKRAIHRLGEKTYRSMKDNFAKAGVERLFVCPGDHGIGDNDWAPGSERSFCVPYHRAVLGRSYNRAADGRWLWPETVCGVPSRPIGTKYADTSFAVQHKNVLFVSIDIFQQAGPNDRLHPRHGSILPDIGGEQLAWFERLLVAGNEEPSVRYIFVQAHTPTLPPVRAQSSSMMMTAGFERSNLWRTMREHDVDLYFAGEVHATTVSKDPESDLVQVVTDRNMPTLITVHPDKLELQCFSRALNEDGSAEEDPLHEEHRLTIDKSGEHAVFKNASGVLRPLDLQAPFIHYAFEQDATLPSGRNRGQLDMTYDARTAHSRSVPGKIGDGLALNKGGYFEVKGTGPFGLFDRTERAFALWFKTDADGKYNLICGGSGKKSSVRGTTGLFDLGIDDGRLFLRTDAGESAIDSDKLNDGLWHHAVVSVGENASTLEDVAIYVDGEKRDWSADVDTQGKVSFRMSIHGISLGGAHRPVWSKSPRDANAVVFDGSIDDFIAWYRELSAAEVRGLYESVVGN